MKFLNGQYYVEVKGKRYIIHPKENIILRKRDPALSLRTQYQNQNENQIRKNQKVIKNNNDELEVENYPKKNKQLNIHNLNHQNVLVANEKSGVNFLKVTIVRIVNILLSNRNIR